MSVPPRPVKKIVVKQSPTVRQALPIDVVNIYKSLIADELNAGIGRQHSPAERIDHILQTVTSGYAVVVEVSGRIVGSLGFFGARTQGDHKATLVCNSGVGWCFFAEHITAEVIDNALDMCTKFADSHDVPMILNVPIDSVMERYLAGVPGTINPRVSNFVETAVEFRRIALSEDDARADNDPEFENFEPPTVDGADFNQMESVQSTTVGVPLTPTKHYERDANTGLDEDTIISDDEVENTVRQYTQKLESEQHVDTKPAAIAIVRAPAKAKRKGTVHVTSGPAKRDNVGSKLADK